MFWASHVVHHSCKHYNVSTALRRVHHGANEQYLDRNYGGILVIWDRLFGSFEPEGERVRYGLTTNLETFNPIKVAFHEYVALARDLRAAGSWRIRWNLLLRGPGYRPPT